MVRINRMLTMLLLVALLISACQPITAQPRQAQSTAAANKEFVLRYFAALNTDKSPATVDAFVTDELLKQRIQGREAAFPGYQLKAEEMIAEGDLIFVRATFTGTHKGNLGKLAPTGKEVTYAIAAIYRIENGKIVDHWLLSDQYSMMQQLGVIPTE